MTVSIMWVAHVVHENIMILLSSLNNPTEHGPSSVADGLVQKFLVF
jgi:hypothetical protein